MSKHCWTLVLCASLLAAGGGEARPQDALIACKSKTIQSHFDSLEDCFSHYSQIEPRVKNTAVQKALLNTLLQLEEIEDLLDIEEKILEGSIAKGEKQDPEVNQRRKRDLDSILGLLGLGGDGNGGGLPGIDDLLRGSGGGDDNSILGVIRGLKQTIKNLIRGIVDTIFGTIGGAVSGFADLLGLDAILGDSRDGAKKKRLPAKSPSTSKASASKGTKTSTSSSSGDGGYRFQYQNPYGYGYTTRVVYSNNLW